MSRRLAGWLVMGASCSVLLVPGAEARSSAGRLEVVSVTSTGRQHGGDMGNAMVSADGRLVVFEADAAGLVPKDKRHNIDVFLRDRVKGTTVRVSHKAAGGELWEDAWVPALSADGAVVSFASGDAGIVGGDTNHFQDAFAAPLDGSPIERVNVASDGAQASEGLTSPYTSLSSNGRFVVFMDVSSNLVPGDGNAQDDVFVHDRLSGATGLVSRTPAGHSGVEGATSGRRAISADGRYVTFATRADDMVPGDHNGMLDVFVYDRLAHPTERASVGVGGVEANGHSGSAAISADGRYVVFASSATNLVPGDTNGLGDVFVYDRVTKRTERVDVRSDGGQASATTEFPAVHDADISGDGRYVCFSTDYSNLVAGDTNGTYDVFRHDRATHTTIRITPQQAGQTSGSGVCSVNADGSVIALTSLAQLLPVDKDTSADVYVWTAPGR